MTIYNEGVEEIMNLKTWTKTMFTVYRHLPRVVRAIDKIFTARALNANQVSGKNLAYNDIYNVAENLINLTERKVNLLNLKVLVEIVIKSLDRESAKYLILRYVDGFSFEQIASLKNVSERTAYRKLNRAVEQAGYILQREGFDEEKLNTKFSNEKWLYELGTDLSSEFRQNSIYLSKIYDRMLGFAR